MSDSSLPRASAIERARRLDDMLARSPRIALGLGLITFLVTAVLGVRDVFLNNEGLYTYIFAEMAGDDPVTTLFFLKSRPPLAALYALPAAFGLDAFVVAHAAVAASTVLSVSALARAFGHARPNVAAALVACSSMLVAAGGAGAGNSDGAAFSALAAALVLAWDLPVAAGVVAGLVPLARAETGLFVLALAIAVALDRPRRATLRFALGALVPLVVYALAGALYHHDAIWFLHYPPHLAHDNGASAIMGTRMFAGGPARTTMRFLVVTPALALLPFVDVTRLSRAERWLGGACIAFLALLTVLAGREANFGDMPRYILPALPFAALLIGRATETLGSGEGPTRWQARIGGALLFALLVAAHRQAAESVALLWVTLGAAAIFVLASTRWRVVAPLATVALASVFAIAFADGTRLLGRGDIRVLGAYLVHTAPPRTVVLTNVAELPTWMARHGRSDLEVRHLMAADMIYEVEALADPSVGQYDALVALFHRHWYGPVVMPDEVHDALVPGTWLALRPDARTDQVLDPAWLEGRGEPISLEYGTRIVRIVSP